MKNNKQFDSKNTLAGNKNPTGQDEDIENRAGIESAGNQDRESDSRPLSDIVEDLHLHQEELKMQNLELQEAQEELEKSRLKYFYLFDLAPVGYVVLDRKGYLWEVNLKASELLGRNRDKLKNGQISIYAHLSQDSMNIFRRHLESVFDKKAAESSIVRMRNHASGKSFVLRLQSTIQGNGEGDELCFSSLTDITEQAEAERALQQSERRFRELFENQSNGIIMLGRKESNLQFVIEDMNSAAGLIIARRRDETIGLPVEKGLPGLAEMGLLEAMQRVWNGATPEEHPSLKYSDGSISFWANFHFFKLPSGELALTIEDVTEQVQAYEDLKDSEAMKTTIIEAIPDTFTRFDGNGNCLDLFSRHASDLPVAFRGAQGKNVRDFLPGNLAEKFMGCLNAALQSGALQSLEYSLESKTGSIDLESRFKASGSDTVVVISRDITEEKVYQDQLKKLSMHDQLTGLYNRAYFEEEINRYTDSRDYPITVISADLDGLKLVNDTMGHVTGDDLLVACAGVMIESLRSSDIIARIGGDEFAALLPRTDQKDGEEIVSRIKEKIEIYNLSNSELPLNISLGVATAKDRNKNLTELMKEADDLMYRDKLYHSLSSRSQLVQTLLATLAERDFITEGHTQRLAEFCNCIGSIAGLSNKQLSDLNLLAQVHDLGKVGIPDNILFKKGPLTEDEWKVMRLHSEKGFRIAISSPDLSRVADLILKHHERFDGSGYPLGLEGEKIPVECRILSIVDAFDAMTNERPYNRVKTAEEALEEIRRYSGFQFDPCLVDIFLQVLEDGSC